MSLNPVTLTQDLIRCPSITPIDAGALDVVQLAAESMGFQCQRFKFGEVHSLYARLGRKRPFFCFAGHTDVVPIGDEAAWTSPPFDAAEIDGSIVGRGAVDMKGAIAAFLAACSRYLDDQEKLGGSLGLLITGDEEEGGCDGTARVVEILKDTDEVPDFCLVGEPTNPGALGEMVKNGRRGSLTGRLTVRGTQGHVAYPKQTNNPVPPMAKILATLSDEVWDKGTSNFPPSHLEVTTVDVDNTADNVVPAKIHAMYNIRFNDLHDIDGLSKRMHEICQKECEASGTSYELKLSSSATPFVTEPGITCDIVTSAVQRVTGIDPTISTTGGTSDARYIRNLCPVLEFGLSNKGAHCVDEQVKVDDLHKLTDIYTAILDRFFKEYGKSE